MPQLKYENVRELDRWEFDEFVGKLLEKYGRTWSIMDSDIDGFHQDTYVSAEVKRDSDIEESTDQNFLRWLEGGQYNDEPGADAEEEDVTLYNKYYRDATPGFQEILQWICNQDYTPEGKYVMHIWW